MCEWSFTYMPLQGTRTSGAKAAQEVILVCSTGGCGCTGCVCRGFVLPATAHGRIEHTTDLQDNAGHLQAQRSVEDGSQIAVVVCMHGCKA